MCGRYELSEALADQELEALLGMSGMSKRGEIFPTDAVSVLVLREGVLQAETMRWGFPQPRGKDSVINARSETADEKPMFQESLFARRCLVASSGYYEWKKQDSGLKQRHLIRLPDSPVLYMAGIYSSFADASGAVQNRFVILTTEANSVVKEIHDRMPVVLRKEEIGVWLDSPDYAFLFDRSRVDLLVLPL